MGIEYMTGKQVKSWAEDLKDDNVLCIHCLTLLDQDADGNWYCPNEMCLYDEEPGELNPTSS